MGGPKGPDMEKRHGFPGGGQIGSLFKCTSNLAGQSSISPPTMTTAAALPIAPCSDGPVRPCAAQPCLSNFQKNESTGRARHSVGAPFSVTNAAIIRENVVALHQLPETPSIGSASARCAPSSRVCSLLKRLGLTDEMKHSQRT